MKNSVSFHISVQNRLADAVLTRTHNLCFWAEIRKNSEHPCKPQFYCIKVGFEGVISIYACFRDVSAFQDVLLE